MDLSEVLSNPLFVPLLVALITIVVNAYFLYWLRNWQYRTEYIIRNVEKTYIPLVAEIHERLEQFNNFLKNPDGLHYRFEQLEGIKKSGLFEFIRSHDKKLFDSLIHFYTQIYPKFEELYKLQIKTRESIRKDWIDYIEGIIDDKNVKKYAGSLVSEFFQLPTFINLLDVNIRLEEFSKKWNESLVCVTEKYNLKNPYVRVSEDKVRASPRVGSPSVFNVSQDEINNLLRLAQPKIQKLLDFFGEIRVELQRNVINDLIPRLQKYITNPLSR